MYRRKQKTHSSIQQFISVHHPRHKVKWGVENLFSQGVTTGAAKDDNSIFELNKFLPSHCDPGCELWRNATKHFRDGKMILQTLALYHIHIHQYLVFFQVGQHQHTAQVEGRVHICCLQGQHEELSLLTSTHQAQ